LSRGDRNRNARLARLRQLLPPGNAIVGIDLADDKQAAVVTDHDSRVIARRRVRARAWELGELLDWAVGKASAAGFVSVTVACEPTGHRWRVLDQLAAGRGLALVCVQPLLVYRAREGEDLTRDKSDPKDAVIIARLAAGLHCYEPERADAVWARLRHLGALVAPVMRVSEQVAYEALRGRRPGLTGLPWVDMTAVADLSRITTVERSVLVDAVTRGRPRTPAERFHFAETISRYLTRPALPDSINEVLSPFVKRIAEKHDRQSAEGRCAHKVWELRLEATPDIDHEEPALNVLMILDEDELPRLPEGSRVDNDRIDRLIGAGRTSVAEAVHQSGDPVAKREAWTALAECWNKPSVDLVSTVNGVGSVEISVMNGEELSYARSRNAPVLDLRYLTTRAA
jgi:hypothetical protein